MNNRVDLSILAPGLTQLAALAVEHNVTRAAARTGTSQPTLSRAIRRWEESLGIGLIESHGRGVRLTEDGQVLAVAALDAIRLMETALARVRGDGPEQSLTIGFLRSLGPTVVGELVSSFLHHAPDVIVAHRELSTTAILDALDAGEIDVAITAPKPPARFAWLPFGSQAISLMVPGSHPLAARHEVQLAEVRDEKFLALNHQYHARQVADMLCAAAGFTPRIVLEANDLITVANYVGAGLGVAIVPADSSTHPRTVNVAIADQGARREFGLAWDPGVTHAVATQFVAHAEALANRYPHWADIDL
ncbi:LysR family transcriptional regulator [Cryobacterium sp. AP23]